MAFSNEQLEKLKQELTSDKVKIRSQDGRSITYVEGYSAIDSANEIFGFGEWDYEIVGGIEGIKTVQAGQIPAKDANGAITGFYDGYVSKAVVKVTVRMPDNTYVSRTDVGLCSPAVATKKGASKPSPEAIDTSEKGAVTDALKRALRSFGNQFGNSLYDKESPLHDPSSQLQANSTTATTVANPSGRMCPNCGSAMERKSGVKGDKSWVGFFCANNRTNPGCKPIWAD